MSAEVWLAIACPVLFIVGVVLGSLYNEIGRRLLVLEEFDPTAYLAAERRQTRDDWADYFERWTQAVGPEPLTVDTVIRLLRAEREPFGCAANPDGAL